MNLRPFKQIDAPTILSWSKTELAFRQWSADRYKQYPAQPQDMIELYSSTENTDNFFPMTAFDGNEVIGHLILRYTDDEKTVIRLGYIIVDDTQRGLGYGKQMLKMAIEYALRFLGAKKITLGVFENNPSAVRCYQAVGFRAIPLEKDEYFEVLNEKWKCIEMELIP